jgi:hypothetical protein
MVDFSNIQKLSPAADALSQVEIPIITKDGADYVVLTVLPALSMNRPFLNAQAKFSSAYQRLTSRKKELGAADLEKLRSDGRKQFAQHIIRGWENVFDAAGNEVTFNETNCFDFLMALPDSAHEDLVEFCMDADNFLELEDSEELGKS